MEPLEPVLERLDLLLQQGADGEAEVCARLLGDRIQAIVDHRQRATVLRDTLESLDDATLLATLHRLMAGATEGRSRHREVIHEISMDADLFKDMQYDRLSDLYRAARAREMQATARLLLGDAHRWNRTVEEAQAENEHLSISSGERKAAARRNDRFVLDRIVHDRNPEVIRAFLDNPRAVERDVIRIAAMRPTNPAILRMLVEHPRWSSRQEVRKALVCNPYTPESLAVRLVPTLLRQHLAFVVTCAGLSSRVREAASEHLGLG